MTRLEAMAAGVALLSAVTLTACDPAGPDQPEGATVELVPSGFDEQETQGPLRYAVGWTFRRVGGHGLLTTDDGPLGHAPSVLVPVSVPSEWRRDDLAPVERLFLGYANNEPLSTEAYRPRFIVYEDVNEDGRFDGDVLDRTGPDRVLGVEDAPASIGFIIDIESVFEEIPFSRTESFYAATSNRFTPFVTVTDSGNMLELLPWNPRVSISFDDSDLPRTSLECLRPAPTAETSRAVLVDESVGTAICGLDIATCEQTVFAELNAPELPEGDQFDPDFIAQCRRRDPLEALIVGSRSTQCEDCTCTQRFVEWVYVTQQAAVPDWWPCGDVLETCTDEDEDPFAVYSETCAEQQRERAHDSVSDD